MSTPSQGASDRLEVYRLALAESRDALQDQRQQPEKIRHNVGALLGFAAVSVTLFGAKPTHEGRLGAVCSVGVLIAVVGLVVCTAAVVAPKKVVPSMDASKIVQWGDEGQTLEAAVRSLTKGNEENYAYNGKMIKTMFRWQIRATVCFGLTAVLLALQAIGS